MADESRVVTATLASLFLNARQWVQRRPSAVVTSVASAMILLLSYVFKIKKSQIHSRQGVVPPREQRRTGHEHKSALRSKRRRGQVAMQKSVSWSDEQGRALAREGLAASE